MTAPKSFKRQLARADRSDSAAAAAHVVIWPERIWQTWRTKLAVPVALDKPADRMPVFVCVTCCGMNRAVATVFSCS